MTTVKILPSHISVEGHSGDKALCSAVSGMIKLLARISEGNKREVRVDREKVIVKIEYGKEMMDAVNAAVEIFEEFEVSFPGKLKVEKE